MISLCRFALVALAATFLVAAASSASAQEAPDAMVKRVSQDVLATIRSDPKVQAGDQARIREVIETKLLPHFDFVRMTALAMRTYSGALNKYRDETLEYRPLRAAPTDTDVTVRTQVLRQTGQPVQIDYSLAKTGDAWKCYDVVVGGVSLVTNYRDEFNEQVRNGGVDGLIKTMSDRNAGAAPK
jgi:phospholipid transport system substrate-binding protein